MARKTPTWVIGCGIGCGVLILGVLVLVGLGIAWTRSTTRGFDQAVAERAEVEERFGRAGEFTPPPDGSIPPERMEVFLAVREATHATRRKLIAFFEKMPLSAEQARELEEKPLMEKLRQALDIAGSAMGMTGDMGAFLHERNRALLDAGMSMGEYCYIYSMAYYSFLGRPPGEGPGDGPGEEDRRVDRSTIQVAGTRARSNIRETLEQILRNQLAAIPDGAEEGLREAVSAELDKMAGDGTYLPWLDGLPEPVVASLEPYRERLVAVYSPMTNEFELAQVHKRGAFSFTAD